jgi:hypothetical protein
MVHAENEEKDCEPWHMGCVRHMKAPSLLEHLGHEHPPCGHWNHSVDLLLARNACLRHHGLQCNIWRINRFVDSVSIFFTRTLGRRTFLWPFLA